jgi:hypothetical protein
MSQTLRMIPVKEKANGRWKGEEDGNKESILEGE